MSNFKKHWDDVPNWAKYTLYAVLGIAGAFLLVDGYGMRNAAGLIGAQAPDGAPSTAP